MANCNLRDGFACYGGVEIWNVCRTLKYIDTGLPRNGFNLNVNRDSSGDFCCGCCDEAYVDPVTDEPPWYDALVPESAEFLGVFPTMIDGLTNSFTSRPSIDTLSGSAIGRRYEQGREIEVEALVFGASCEGAEYGLAWLQATLERDCGGAGFVWQACCPAEGTSPGDFSAQNYRTIPCVALTEGIEAELYQPEILQGYVYQVSFTLTAERNWIYDQPELLFEGLIIPGALKACAEYTPKCVDGAVFEVYVDRSLNTGTTSNLRIYSHPSKHQPPGASSLNAHNADWGARIIAGPGESIVYDPRCLGISTASITGKAVRPARNVALIPRAKGLFGVAQYGETWRVCVQSNDNGLGQIGVRIQAYPRRRV